VKGKKTTEKVAAAAQLSCLEIPCIPKVKITGLKLIITKIGLLA